MLLMARTMIHTISFANTLVILNVKKNLVCYKPVLSPLKIATLVSMLIIINKKIITLRKNTAKVRIVKNRNKVTLVIT